MNHQLEQDKNINFSYVNIHQKVLKRMISDNGISYYILLYTAIFTTLFIVSYLRPPKFYKVLISKILNLSFKFKGTLLIVNQFVLWLLIISAILLIFLQMLTYQFSPSLNIDETYENKMYRLKYKWMLETQIWLLTLIVIEIGSIYKLSSIYDEILEIKDKINQERSEEKKEEKEKIENMPTTESMRCDTNENIVN
jgi:hypothetical protein